MRVTTVRVRYLTTRLKLQLCSVVGQPPGHQVQDVLRQLTAGPLVPVDDGEVQRDHAESLTRDPMALDPVVTLAGPG